MPGSLFNLGRYFKKKEPQEPAQEGQSSVGQLQDEVAAASAVTPQQATTPEPLTGLGQARVATTIPTAGTEPPASPVGQASSADYQSAPKEPTDSRHYKELGDAKLEAGGGDVQQKFGPLQPGQEQKTDNRKQITEEKETEFQKRAGMDILSRMTQRSNKVLMAAVNKAKELQNQYIDTEHILWGLMQDSGVYQLVSEFKITPTELLKEIESKFKQENFKEQPKFSPRVKKVLELSLSAARSLGFEFISPEHILLALAQEGEGLAAQILTKYGLTVERLNTKITGKKEKEKKEEKNAVLSFTTDLTQMAREGKLDPVVARSQEIERIMHILSRRTKNNPVLIGDAGVGKTAVVEGLAQRIVEGKVPETLLNKKILSVDLMSLIAGASHRGEFEERLKQLISEVKAARGEIILFIDEIHNMVGAGSGGEGAMDASNILKPSLARGELQTIGTTTITEYRKHMEKDPALERRFQPIRVAEPSADQALEMLRALKDKYEAFHKVSISDEAVEAAVRLSKRYIGDRFLPDKAVDLIDEAGSAIRLPAISLPEEIRTLEAKIKKLEGERTEAESQGDQVRLGTLDRELTEAKKQLEEKSKQHEVKKGMTTNVVTPEIIQEIISRWTGIPISRLTESESAKLVKLEDILHKRIIDQEEAVAAVSEAVRRGRAGLTSSKRPIGSFIFMGPTGVGKTELAKALAEELFGSEEMTVRLDMSEYMEKHEVAKLIGAPPGYVGYEEGGQLTEAVRRKPYSVVLLDEIEKANPDVFNILIQLLDDGRLTDNKGRTISFKNTIVIATSNIGTGLIQKEMLAGMEVGEIKEQKEKSKEQIDTYTITPTGREIVTRDGEYWEKSIVVKGESRHSEGAKATEESPADVGRGAANKLRDSSPSAQNDKKTWKKGKLEDYFGGQTVKGADILNPKQKFPIDGFNTHVVLPSGEEIISREGRLWRRKSTTAKEWESLSLIDYFKEHRVVNAAPDKPEEQLPTASWQTHAVSPGEKEIIGVREKFWVRENLQTKEWKVIEKKEYVVTATEEVEPQRGSTSESQKKRAGPLEKAWKVHLFTPEAKELVVVDSDYWSRKGEEPWQKEKLIDLLKGENSPVSEPSFAKASEGKEKEEFEQKFAELAEKLLEELRKFFKPELLNRFDEIIVFRPLTAQHMLLIVDLQIHSLAKLLEEQNLGFEVADRAKEELAMVGFDPIYGARPLRRTIQRLIENPISTMLIKGELKSGDIIVVDFESEKDEFVFTAKRMPSKMPASPAEEAGSAGVEGSSPPAGEAGLKAEGEEKEVEPQRGSTSEIQEQTEPSLRETGLQEAQKAAEELGKTMPQAPAGAGQTPPAPAATPREVSPPPSPHGGGIPQTPQEPSSIPHFSQYYGDGPANKPEESKEPPAVSASQQMQPKV